MPYTMETREDPKVGLAADMLRDCGRVQLQAWGTSMLPSLWPGDLLTIESVAHSEVVPGDIVLVLRDHAFLIHRLVERRQDQGCISWITKGDAVPRNDPPAGASQLLGRVTGIQHGIRLLVPSRRVSLLHSVLAWGLCHSDRFRNLTLRVHATRAQAGVRGVAGISPSHTSHP
jgi:signal peptidase I